MLGNQWFRKESPLLSLLGLGGGGAGQLTAGGAGTWAVASPTTTSIPGQACVCKFEDGPNDMTYVIFYDPGTVTIAGSVTAEGALLVGGGGCGGAPGGGGGGAGGVLLDADDSLVLSGGTYNVTIGDGAPPVRSESPANPEGPSSGNIPWLSPSGPVWPSGGNYVGFPGGNTIFGTYIAYGGENGGAEAPNPTYPEVKGYPAPAPEKSFTEGGAPYVPWDPPANVGSGGAHAYAQSPTTEVPAATFQQPSGPFTGYGNSAGTGGDTNGGSGGAGGAGNPKDGSPPGRGGPEVAVPTGLLPDPVTGSAPLFPGNFLNVGTTAPSAQRRSFAGGASAYPDRARSAEDTGGGGGPTGPQSQHSGTNFRGGGAGGMNTPNPQTNYGWGGKGVFIIKFKTSQEA